jgi:hypothetical protein
MIPEKIIIERNEAMVTPERFNKAGGWKAGKLRSLSSHGRLGWSSITGLPWGKKLGCWNFTLESAGKFLLGRGR